MINRLLTYFFVVVISTICAQCEPACPDGASTDSSDQFIKFTQDISAIDEEGNFTLSFAFLLGSPKFRRIWENSRDNVDSCIRYISEPDHTYQQREIALLSMSKLDVGHYVDFAQKLSELLGKHLVNYYEFYSAIIPTYEFSPTAVENYSNPNIRDVLGRIRGLPEIDAVGKAGIDNILSGAAYEGLSEFREISRKSQPKN
jgi:hypothetical protein